MTNETLQQPQATSEPLGKKTINSLTEGLESGKSAAVSQVIRLIQDITSKVDTISVDQLADLISRDLATMTKVLGVANTIGFNPTGSEITTVHQAIQTVGFEKIRNIAMALLLLDSAEQGAAGREKQQVAALALASGALAQGLLEQVGRGADPEEGFVCAALRSYGQLLLVNFLPEEFQKARALVTEQKRTWDQACLTQFGLTALEIGQEMLARGQVAKSLLSTLCPVGTDLLHSKSHSPTELLLLAADFSTRFCEMASSTSWSFDEMKTQAQKLAKQYGAAFPLDEQDLLRMFERTERRLTAFGRAQGLQGFSSPVMQRLAGTIPKGPTTTTPKEGQKKPSGIASLVERLGAGADGKPLTLQGALTGALELLQEELHLEQCVVFLKDEILPTWSARVGRGPLFEAIQSQPLLSADTRNVFTICLTRGEDVLIQSPNEASIRKYVPEWLRPHLLTHPLLLLSLRDADGTYGVICATGKNAQSISLTSQLAQPLKELRKVLGSLNRLDLAA